MDFEIAKCKTKAGYSAKPIGKVRLDLSRIKDKFKVVADTPIVLVIDEGGEIIIHNHGEIMFKEHKDMKDMEDIAKRIYSAGRT